jgi:hypothetical protein
VTKLGQDVAPVNQEHAGQLADQVAGLPTEAMSCRAGRTTHPEPRVQELNRPSRLEAERLVMQEARVADPGDRVQPSPRKPGVGFPGSGAVHERHRRSGRVDGRAMSRDIGQRLATEGSAEVAKKDDQGRPIARQGLERGAWRVVDRPRRHLVIS